MAALHVMSSSTKKRLLAALFAVVLCLECSAYEIDTPRYDWTVDVADYRFGFECYSSSTYFYYGFGWTSVHQPIHTVASCAGGFLLLLLFISVYAFRHHQRKNAA